MNCLLNLLILLLYMLHSFLWGPCHFLPSLLFLPLGNREFHAVDNQISTYPPRWKLLYPYVDTVVSSVYIPVSLCGNPGF